MDTEKDKLDPRLERLGEELRNRLDPQIGRAAPYFLEWYAVEHGQRPVRRPPHVRRLVLLATTAAILCVAFVAWQQGRPWKPPAEVHRELVVVAPPNAAAQRHVTTQEPPASQFVDQKIDDGQPPAVDEPENERESSDPQSAGEGGRHGAAERLILGHTLKTRTFDEGTLLVGRTPVRKVRRQWLERVEWFDPQNGARMQRIVPHEEVVFVPLPIN